MSYSTVLFSNLSFHMLEILWTLKIFNNFSSCEILIYQVVELLFFFYPGSNIKITKDELFDGFIIEFIFSFFKNYLNTQNI